MAEKKPRVPKGEPLSLRLDSKSKFQLDLVARLRGQSLTAVIERAVEQSANDLTKESTLRWQELWHPNDHVRFLKLIMTPGFPTTADEDTIKWFVESHPDFFFESDVDGKPIVNQPHVARMIVLWPGLARYGARWERTMGEDRWGAARMMAEDLLAAGVRAPHVPDRPTPRKRLVAEKALEVGR